MLTDCRLVTKPQRCTSIYSLDLDNEVQLGYRYVDKPSSVQPCDTSQVRLKNEYTFFTPNGTAIESFRRDKLNRVIFESKKSYSRILRRHIVNKMVYLEKLSVGLHHFENLLGESITIRKNYFRIETYEVNFRGRSAEVLQADLGATNGVIHIINAVLFTDEDKGIGAGHRLTSDPIIALATALFFVLYYLNS